MKIKARFKGQPNSLGYRPGVEYILSFRTQNDISRPFHKHITINRIEAGVLNVQSYCPYESLKGFLKNWEVL